MKKSINEFVKEMREVFGDDQLEICVWGPDGKIFSQTKNWLTDEQLIKREKIAKLKSQKVKDQTNGSGYKNV